MLSGRSPARRRMRNLTPEVMGSPTSFPYTTALSSHETNARFARREKWNVEHL
jgi:hypothetical protein